MFARCGCGCRRKAFGVRGTQTCGNLLPQSVHTHAQLIQMMLCVVQRIKAGESCLLLYAISLHKLISGLLQPETGNFAHGSNVHVCFYGPPAKYQCYFRHSLDAPKFATQDYSTAIESPTSVVSPASQSSGCQQLSLCTTCLFYSF